jgi:hypothetical protein
VSTPARVVVLWLVLLMAVAAPATAQGTFNLLGNRNHPELTWSVYDTEHFRVVFSDGLAAVASRAGSIAEQAYAIQRQNLGLTFNRRYYIFLSDRDQVPNGGTTPFGYMFVYVNPAQYIPLFSNKAGWLETVIPHELVHALLFENTGGWLSIFLPFGRGSIPSEIHEGMAQLYGGEAWSVERGDRHLNRLVRNYQTRVNPFTIDAGPETYAVGFAKVKWLRQALTDQQVGSIFSREHAKARFNFGEAFKRVAGRDYSNVEDEWRRAVNVYYNWREGTAERTEDLGATLKELTADQYLAVKRSPSGGGTAFAGIKRRQNPNVALYYHDAASKRLTRLAEKSVRGNFSFDRAGQRIAFSRWHFGAHGDILADLYLVDVRTGDETAVTHNLRAVEPVFVGAQELVFVKQDGLISNLYRLSLAEGATPEKLTDFSTEWHFADLSASPDGRYVAAAFVNPGAQRQGIAILDVTTRTLVEHPQPAIARAPLFAPHGGNEILFTSDEDGVRNVYRLDLATARKTAVTKQANSVLITDWPEEHKAYGIRQIDDQPEAFVLDPYRTAQSFPAELQPYYRQWRDVQPAAAMVFEDQPAAGDFRGPFRALSTFRPLGIVPSLALIQNHLAVGVQGLAADMPGKHLLAADVLSNFRAGSTPNFGVNYLNRTTRFDLSAQVEYRDVTTYYFYGAEDLFEGVWSARSDLTIGWEQDSHYRSQRLHAGVAVADSEILSTPPSGATGPQTASRSAEPYRMGSLFADYRFSRVQPYAAFPEDGTWLEFNYAYDRSLDAGTFSYQTISLGAHRLHPLAGSRLNVLASALVAAQPGKVPEQDRLGMAKYSSSNSLLSYSKQVYVRGGDQYLPGDRLFTGTLELRVPSDLLELVSFVDLAQVWGEGSSAAREDRNQLSVGAGLRLPPVLGSSVEMGWAWQLNKVPSDEGRFYLMVQRIVPF